MPGTDASTQTTALQVRKRPGRRSIRTEENRGRIIQALARGIPFGQVCAAVRVSKAALSAWRAADSEFEAQIEASRAEAVQARLAIIERAAAKDWRAAAWLLERTQPETFGRQRGEQQHVHIAADKVVVYLPQKGEDGEPKQIRSSND